MGLFSERYGYTKPSDVIIREQITPEIGNAICNCYEFLKTDLLYYGHNIYRGIKLHIWTNFLDEKITDYDDDSIIEEYIDADEIDWFYKLDLIEFSLDYIEKLVQNGKIANQKVLLDFVQRLNKQFQRLNFAYRVIDNKIVEITSKEEIIAIESALAQSQDNVKSHLNKALELYALRPEGDYCNSIKESISAVEAYCREKTGENTLGDALKKLEKVGIVIPNILKVAFDKLYAYTNQPTTGIRHALMDNEGTYVPKAEEALFMLVSCSAFINYLGKKEL